MCTAKVKTLGPSYIWSRLVQRYAHPAHIYRVACQQQAPELFPAGGQALDMWWFLCQESIYLCMSMYNVWS
jgi:hypothetical protein